MRKFNQILKLFTLIIIILIFINCKKNTNNSTGNCINISDGIIIAADYRKCVCCGGWFLKINNDTLRIFKYPQEFNDSLNNKSLPVYINLTWIIINDECKINNNLIELKSFKILK